MKLYIDPGTGSMLFTILIGVFFVLTATFPPLNLNRSLINNIRNE